MSHDGRADAGYTSIMIDSTVVGATDLAVRRFKALGDPTRLRILQVLADGERCVCDVQAEIDVAANLLSHHLKVLREAGLVQAERRGRWVDYRLDVDAVASVTASLPVSDRGTAAARCACGRDDEVEVRA
ncbi:MAG: metalloregulator ArsR/SmtB family transcription factor [Deinococcus-Thermus bacterium]|jgi:ArsR family transcriptional regulator|nr:metalloregulator ArsR/SmtB family transcription factor [Deinococcota bacterium]